MIYISTESSPRACLCTDPGWCCDQANTPPRALVWTAVQVRDRWSWCGMCWRASLLYAPRLKAPVSSSLMKRGEQNKRNAM